MSGVIMDGVQYEHCCQCGEFVALSKLLYAKVRSDLTPRWPQYEMQDLCTESYMRACERDSPNSLGLDALVESIYEQLCEENWHAA